VLIIILTAYDYSAIEDEARAAGVDGFMAKPFFMNSFEKAIRDTGRLKREDEEEDRKQAGTNSEEADITGLNILAAEDNEFNAEILVEILKMNGVSVTVEPDGLSAVENFKKSEPGKYDLILMDIQMPVMNGYEATKAIRAMAADESGGISERKKKKRAASPS